MFRLGTQFQVGNDWNGQAFEDQLVKGLDNLMLAD